MDPVTLDAPPAPAFRRLVSGSIHAAVEEIGGRPAIVVRTTSDVHRGALGLEDGETIRVAAASASALRVPIVIVLASSGADVSEGVASLHGWGRAAQALAGCSGVVPFLTVVTGPALSGPALLVGLSDLTVMTPDAYAFVSGPTMVEEFTGVRIGIQQLGGTAMHARSSGLCSLEAASETDAIAQIEAVLEMLPAHTDELPPIQPVPPGGQPCADETLPGLVPDRTTSSYDVRRVAERLADEQYVVELWTRWAPQLVTALGRIDGRPVGFVANQPQALAGTLDITASQKGARFVRFCDAFNLPLVTLVDTPGFLPGKDLEWRGMIRHGAELAFAYSEATVPRVCVILRKAYGGAYIVMDSKGLGNDLCFAWPGSEIAVMGAEGAVQILHRRASPEEQAALRDEYAERYLTPWEAAERGFVDAVIDPADTRLVISDALAALETSRERLPGRKHTGGPL
jgi:acetyl-CoA carboxylase carboxyltransferase component